MFTKREHNPDLLQARVRRTHKRIRIYREGAKQAKVRKKENANGRE